MEIVIKKPTIPGAEKPGCEHPPAYRGKPGPQGPAGTIEIAQVVTIEPSDPARVENIGDKTNAKFILYIPKGDPGNRGEPGPAVEITEDIIQAITNELDLTPELVGLGNVDNTSDMNKPVSTAQAEAIEKVRKGAAPAGYGLGGSAISVNDLNAALNCGFFTWGSGCANAPFDYGTVMVLNRYNDQITQVAFNPQMAGVGEITVRHFYDGEWLEWEYVNPPMELGVEYRTIERSDGKPVYVKRISFGALPASGSSNVPTGISGGKLVSLTGTFFNGGESEPYPIMGASGSKILCWLNSDLSILYAQAIKDCSSYTGEFVIKRTKN